MSPNTSSRADKVHTPDEERPCFLVTLEVYFATTPEVRTEYNYKVVEDAPFQIDKHTRINRIRTKGI